MQERYIEIKFYYYISKLLAKFRYSVKVLDIVEAICSLGDIDVAVINQFIKQIRSGSGVINTYAAEAVYIGRQNKISYRKLEKETGVSVATQVRMNKEFETNGWKYENITGKLNAYQYEQVNKFMKIVTILKEL